MSENTTRVLTGITTSGTPHLGNYAGAIRPAIATSRTAAVESFYFLADYHALVKVQDPARVQRSTLEIAATWLACGLNPDSVWFYRQSDVPEITELNWLLTCVAGKGLLNRAHAYKAAVDKNAAEGTDDDAGISAGLFMYPVLMAADILLFKANTVPVGRDQIQHIEMARDFAQRFNHVYGEHFVLPDAAIEDNVATLPGLDGRKMSKSYDNTIPLFASRDELKKLIAGIVTDSSKPGEAKPTQGSALFEIYTAFANESQSAEMAAAFQQGIGWGEAKSRVFDLIDAEIAPLRAHYEALIAKPADLEARLRDGAHRLRERYAIPFMAELRDAVGLRDLSKAGTPRPRPAVKSDALPVFKQYRDGDGSFKFKLTEGDRVLLQSAGFASPKACGESVAALKTSMQLQDASMLADDVDAATVNAALMRLAAAEAARRQAKA